MKPVEERHLKKRSVTLEDGTVVSIGDQFIVHESGSPGRGPRNGQIVTIMGFYNSEKYLALLDHPDDTMKSGRWQTDIANRIKSGNYRPIKNNSSEMFILDLYKEA